MAVHRQDDRRRGAVVGTANDRPSPTRGFVGPTTNRDAFGYLSLDRGMPEQWLRRRLAEYARLEALPLRHVFVDARAGSPHGFGAMRRLLHERDVRIVLLPDLAHVTHIPTVARLGQAGLSRWLGAVVLLTEVEPAPSACWDRV